MPVGSESSNLEYKNKFIINQRGGTVEINNSTGREEVKISQFDGSNITLNNTVNSELASNNKQTKIVYDEYRTIGNTQNTFIGKDRNLRTVENNYEIKGFEDDDAIAAYNEWKEVYRPIAEENSKFEVQRGGQSHPNGVATPRSGTGPNPDFKYTAEAVKNDFYGYVVLPDTEASLPEEEGIIPASVARVYSDYDGVTYYEELVGPLYTDPAIPVAPTIPNIEQAFGAGEGTAAPGILEQGVTVASATEGWGCPSKPNAPIIAGLLRAAQPTLNPIEKRMGNGGDDILFTKRHKVENIGATFNDYPSVRVDEIGRLQSTEVGVSEDRVFKHHDYVRHVEEVENESNFPCGNYTLAVGNRYNVLVGSGGVQIKTSGSISLNGSYVKVTGIKIDMAADAGISIGSESHVDIYAKKIQFRSERQVYVDGSFGVLKNIIVGGGAFIEGELYVNHITAPVEVQETLHTKVFGEIIDDYEIGYAYLDPGVYIGSGYGYTESWYYDEEGNFVDTSSSVSVDVYGSGNILPVYGVATPDSLKVYDHSHHFHNIPLRLTRSNKNMRNLATKEGVNSVDYPVMAQEQRHEFKKPVKVPDFGA